MNGNSPLVSVVIPCYNSEKHLQETLDSVYSQAYPNVEIICVDNGSSDHTIDLIKKNQAEHDNLKLFIEEKRGASRARNLGLKNANGEYIQFLDSDDIITPDKLEKQIQYALNNDLDVVVSDRIVMDERLEKELESYTFEEIIEKPLETAITKIIITGNPIYRKAVVESVEGYTPELPMAQDWDFHIKLFLTHPTISYIKGAFLICRQVETSLSSDWIEVSEYSSLVLDKYRKSLLHENVLDNIEVRRKIINSYFASAVHSTNKAAVNYYLEEIEHWFNEISPCPYLYGTNKVLCKIFGIKKAIEIKRILVRP